MENGNVDAFVRILNELLSAIPYDDYTRAALQKVEIDNLKIPAQEWLYRSTILAFVRGTGIKIQGEVHSSKGRADLVITTYNNITWVIEIKIAFKSDDVASKLSEAITQFKENDYSKPYENAKSIALVIDDTKRQITEKREW
jgi:hypothetical protein